MQCKALGIPFKAFIPEYSYLILALIVVKCMGNLGDKRTNKIMHRGKLTNLECASF